jgi:uncharacterized repeat protein (TIGR02543 family)
MIKKGKRLFIISIIAILLFFMAMSTSYAVSTVKTDKTGEYSVIESKEKAASYKITWNGNGGKIGSKKTVSATVKKGSKIKNLAKTPKRSGYTFKGWYTKKSGGTKISKNTKPTKSVTYYAQWKKKSRALTTEEKKFIEHSM